MIFCFFKLQSPGSVRKWSEGMSRLKMISEEIRILILKSDEASAAMGKLKFMCQATICGSGD